MRDGYIAVIDSGIGGLNVLRKLVNDYPEEKFLYFGDNGNAPYGNKSVDELFSITIKNLKYLNVYNIKALVLGCNTLSTCLLKEISKRVNYPVFGVTPPVEQAKTISDKVLLLATARTAERYNSDSKLDVVGLTKLARAIEKNIFNLSVVAFDKHLSDESIGKHVNEKGYYDTVILGCTHYGFIKNQIFDHFRPRKLFAGEDFISKRLLDFLKNEKSSVNCRGFPILFVGNFADFNKKVFLFSG